MSPALRTITSATAGAVVATAVCLGQPALAAHQHSASAPERTAAKSHQITSYRIKNHTIKTKDLSATVNGLLGLAGSALQSVPTNGVTRDKMADNAVGSAEVINNSLVAGDLAANAVGSSEIADGAVTSKQVADGSLTSADVTSVHGVVAVTVAGSSIAANACVTAPVATTKVLDNDLIVVTPGASTPAAVQVAGRQTTAGGTEITVSLCNYTNAAVTTPSSVSVAYAVIDN